MSQVSDCDHGITFDEAEARKILGVWRPANPIELVLGNPAAREVRRRWPRLNGPCSKGCGFIGIYYASSAHYVMGDW